MSGGTRIIAFGQDGQHQPEEEILLYHEVATLPAQDFEPDEAVRHPVPARWPAAVAIGLALAWTALFVWARTAEIAALGAQGPQSAAGTIAGWLSDWAPPVLLVAVVWLVAMRNSRREADRFAAAARMLSDESARLEQRLTTVNRELSLAREFIAAQGRDLEALGRIASERLSQNAERLQSLIHDNGARVDAIGSVSQSALDNMEKLRSQLPVIASSAKDVTNHIGNAGRTAHAQLQEMIAGFRRLNDFGQASERQVQSLRLLVDDTIAEFTHQSVQLDDIASARFAALAERGEAFRMQLDAHEVEALAAIRTRAAAMAEEIEQTRELLDSREADSITSLRARLSALRDEGSAIARSLRDGEQRAVAAWRETLEQIEQEMRAVGAAMVESNAAAHGQAQVRIDALRASVRAFEQEIDERARTFDTEMARRRSDLALAEETSLRQTAERLSELDSTIAAHRHAHEAQTRILEAQARTIADRLDSYGERMADAARFGAEAEERLAATLRALADGLMASRTTLTGFDADVAALTDASVRLLELLQASTRQGREELPPALAVGENTLSALENRVMGLRGVLGIVREEGAALAGTVDQTGVALGTILTEIEGIQARLETRTASHSQSLAEVRQSLDAAETQSERLAARTRQDLSSALAELGRAAQQAIAEMGVIGPPAVAALARQLGEESAAAIDKAMRTSAAEISGQLEQAAHHAAGVSREAAIQLRDQLAKVNELTGNLERRVAHARQRAEEQVDNDFARRVALITESLNSNAIDIAKAMSTEVSDVAWAAYLRGDRGIFTRRAVSLLESADAKAIAQIYERDDAFREHVSRYIHDFEAILRQVLSTRDGHPLGVTLLSSDMGKLYVALAQAIERLRA